MKVKELIATCQNQWLNLFKQNPLFKITFTFKDAENIETYSIKEFNDFELDGITNTYIFNKINQRHEQEVLAWHMEGKNDIFILVKEF